MAKITQVIDSQLWQENLEEQIILKKFRAKKPHYPPPPKDQAKWILLKNKPFISVKFREKSILKILR